MIWLNFKDIGVANSLMPATLKLTNFRDFQG